MIDHFLLRTTKAGSLTLAVYGGLAFAYGAGRVYTANVGWYAPFCDDNAWMGTFEQFMTTAFMLSATGFFLWLALREVK